MSRVGELVRASKRHTLTRQELGEHWVAQRQAAHSRSRVDVHVYPSALLTHWRSFNDARLDLFEDIATSRNLDYSL